MELKINQELEKVIPPLSPEDYSNLCVSLKEKGQKVPLDVMKDGTIIDGHNRYKILKELGTEPKYNIDEDVTTIGQALNMAMDLNLARRHFSTAQRVKYAFDVEKEILALEAKERQTRGLASPEAEVGRTADKIGEKIGVSGPTVERGFKVLKDAPEELKKLWLDEAVTTHAAYITTCAFKDMPEENVKPLLKMIVEDPEEVNEVRKIVGNTNAVKAWIDGESEEVKKQALKEFENRFYTKELDLNAVKYRLEELAGDSHPLSTVMRRADEIGEAEEEAAEYFRKYGGSFIRKLICWEGTLDKVKEAADKDVNTE